MVIDNKVSQCIATTWHALKQSGQSIFAVFFLPHHHSSWQTTYEREGDIEGREAVQNLKLKGGIVFLSLYLQLSCPLSACLSYFISWRNRQAGGGNCLRKKSIVCALKNNFGFPSNHDDYCSSDVGGDIDLLRNWITRKIIKLFVANRPRYNKERSLDLHLCASHTTE